MKNKLFRLFINITSLFYLIFDEVFSWFYDKVSLVISKIPNITEIADYNIKLLRNQNRYVILTFLILLIILSEYVGIISLMMFGTGHILYGITLYIIKFIPFFLMSFVFKNSKDVLLEISWFDWCYGKFESLRDYLKSTVVYIKIMEFKETIKIKIKNLRELINL